ncbi:MAG: alpha/beta hydrolase [Stagnimonas sp.]|nr:alpha/beta hydrolase [Stagnimonas sp.]
MIRLAHQQWGSGPDAVLIHGLGASRAFWFPRLAMSLAATHRVTIYDLRGHGYSERPASGYRVSDHADDLLGLLDELRIERAALIGHSLGGSVAFELALRAPGRVSHLALLDSRIQRLQPTMCLREVEPLSAYEQQVAQRAGGDWENETEVGLRFIEAAARLMLAAPAEGLRDEFTPFGEGRGARRAAKQFVDLLDQTSLPQDFPQPGAEVAEYAKARMPTLLLYAQPSRALRSAEVLAQALPQATSQQLDGAGHFFPITHPERTAAAVCGLLAR